MPSCPQCGASAKTSARFCTKCGVRLAAAGLDRDTMTKSLPVGTPSQSGRYQIIGQLDESDEFLTGRALVHVPDRLIVHILDGVAIVADALDNEVAPDPCAHVRMAVAVALPRIGQQVVDALVPLHEIPVLGAAQRIEVGEALALDRLGPVTSSSASP